MTRFPTFIGAVAMLATALAVPACSDDSSVDTPTSPTVVADPTSTELFADTLSVGGTAFYSFSVAAYGTVNLTLEAVEGALVPPTVMIGLGIGTPSGIDCVTTSTINTPAGTTAQITGVYDAGVYCAKVWDIGNLYAPATVRVVIAHP